MAFAPYQVHRQSPPEPRRGVPERRRPDVQRHRRAVRRPQGLRKDGVFPASPGRPCWAVRGIPCGMSGILWAVLGIPLASVGDPLRSARDPLGCFGNPPPRESPRRSPRESPWDRLAGWRFGGNRRGPMVQGDGATPNCPNGEGP
eukprot:gene12907-biopygen9501